MLRPIAVLLLDLDPFHIVSVHDLLDALVIVQDGEAWHLIKVAKMAIVAITTADKFVTSVLKSVALEVSIFHRALHPLLMRLL